MSIDDVIGQCRFCRTCSHPGQPCPIESRRKRLGVKPRSVVVGQELRALVSLVEDEGALLRELARPERQQWRELVLEAADILYPRGSKKRGRTDPGGEEAS